MSRKTIGIAAHVDAGKTTLSERILYQAGAIPALGRVDHGNAFLDADPVERQRGITILAGVARMRLGEDSICWVDTPGHSDFSAEMERALGVMDAAVLVVSAADGIQSHTETLWRLMREKRLPVFLFLNKTDLPAANVPAVLADLKNRFSEDVLDLRCLQETDSLDEFLREELALRDDSLMSLLDSGDDRLPGWLDGLRRLFLERRVFPVMAGSALSGEGTAAFLRWLNTLTSFTWDERAPASGVVWKVRHDARGRRLCDIKLLTGCLRVKDSLMIDGAACQVNEILLCHGERTQRVEQAAAGELVTLTGMDSLKAGDGFGGAQPLHPRLAPMVASDVLWEDGTPLNTVLSAMRTLEEEEPTLSVEVRGEHLSVHVMGRIQLEILQSRLLSRFGLRVAFGPFRVLWRETIAAPAVGIGHYEPLRHYAEVWLRLVPGRPGSGITFRSLAHVDDLALNWQRLIETHIFERTYPGVLTGSPLTDVEVQLLAGRAHLKHTEGGDFRQATGRALRNALMHAKSILLEPLSGFEARFPRESWGAVLGSLQALQAELEAPEPQGDQMIVRGEAPYAQLQAWQDVYPAMTHGRGTLRVWPTRYAPVRNQAEAVASAGYNPLANLEDTPDSVFCSHGAGYNVAWDKVRDFAHLQVEGAQG